MVLYVVELCNKRGLFCAVPNLDSLSQTSKEVDNEDRVILGRRKDEIRVIRRRDQNQPRKRTQRTCRDNATNSSGSAQRQQWRLMDLFSDSNLEKSKQKQNSFLSLLPPPPPRIMSKILPPSLSTNYQAFYHTEPKPVPTQIMKNSQVKLQEMTPIVGRDKDELLNGISKFIKKPIEMMGSRNYGKPEISMPEPIAENTRTIHIRTSLAELVSPSKIAVPSIKGWSTLTGGVYYPQRTAPAVQIRSVIPVCATPPPIRPSPSTKESVSTAFSKLKL